MLEQFEQLLASEDSATEALACWCRLRGFVADPVIAAWPVPGGALEAPDDVRARLGVTQDARLAYRHVKLACGDVVLSDARNWYVPALLPLEMNQRLAAGDMPFGAVIAPLGFRRERLASLRGPGPGCPADTILTNRALIRLPSGRPLSFVVECYTAANLAPARQ
jgi:chorismate-pyruvate lyase